MFSIFTGPTQIRQSHDNASLVSCVFEMWSVCALVAARTQRLRLPGRSLRAALAPLMRLPVAGAAGVVIRDLARAAR